MRGERDANYVRVITQRNRVSLDAGVSICICRRCSFVRTRVFACNAKSHSKEDELFLFPCEEEEEEALRNVRARAANRVSLCRRRRARVLFVF